MSKGVYLQADFAAYQMQWHCIVLNWKGAMKFIDLSGDSEFESRLEWAKLFLSIMQMLLTRYF